MIDDEAPILTLPRPKIEPYICDDAPVVMAAPEIKFSGIIVFAPRVVAAAAVLF